MNTNGRDFMHGRQTLDAFKPRANFVIKKRNDRIMVDRIMQKLIGLGLKTACVLFSHDSVIL
jgi:hypothetical protein